MDRLDEIFRMQKALNDDIIARRHLEGISDTEWIQKQTLAMLSEAAADAPVTHLVLAGALAQAHALYDEAAAGRDSDNRAWLIAVAHPRIPRSRDRLTREEARAVLTKTEGLALTFAGRGGIHPLENVDCDNLRPGLRR